MAVDLPALERPANATSGTAVAGRSRRWLTVIKKRAWCKRDMRNGQWGGVLRRGACCAAREHCHAEVGWLAVLSPLNHGSNGQTVRPVLIWRSIRGAWHQSGTRFIVQYAGLRSPDWVTRGILGRLPGCPSSAGKPCVSFHRVCACRAGCACKAVISPLPVGASRDAWQSGSAAGIARPIGAGRRRESTNVRPLHRRVLTASRVPAGMHYGIQNKFREKVCE